jgi:hypothetical protein
MRVKARFKAEGSNFEAKRAARHEQFVFRSLRECFDPNITMALVVDIVNTAMHRCTTAGLGQRIEVGVAHGNHVTRDEKLRLAEGGRRWVGQMNWAWTKAAGTWDGTRDRQGSQ